MSKKKDRRDDQADMKKKCYNSYPWTFSHICTRKWNYPVEKGTQSVFQTHVRVNDLSFLGPVKKRDDPVDAATNKHNECNPDHRAFYKVI